VDNAQALLDRKPDHVPHALPANSLLNCLNEIQQRWQFSSTEHACVIYRSVGSGYWETKSEKPGNVASVHIDLKAIVRELVDERYDAVILCHYHPTGSTKPSEADFRVTRTVAQFCRALEVQLMDHIILGTNSCFSFREAGYL